MSITEEGYASLIMGHSQTGNMESARSIIDRMKENGILRPGLTSYSALLSGMDCIEHMTLIILYRPFIVYDNEIHLIHIIILVIILLIAGISVCFV